MNKDSKILITGASGLIGSALVRLLRERGYGNLLIPTRKELDLTIQQWTNKYIVENKPEYVFHLAALVGGIKSNTEQCGDFCCLNTLMQTNVFLSSVGIVKKLLFPGSACAYPRLDRPIKESDFLQGRPEETSLPYAVAKINGIVMAQSIAKQYGMKVVLPMVTNTYGIGDRSTHVIPEMIKRFRGGNFSIMGMGKPIREFIYVDDVADAFLFLMENYDSSDIVNVGSGEEICISHLGCKIANQMGSETLFVEGDPDKDGAPYKALDSSKLFAMGWRPKVMLDEGLRRIIVA